VLAVHQSMRAVDIKFVVAEDDVQAATIALHDHAIARPALAARRAIPLRGRGAVAM
jgi:hypothetical protein